METQNVARSFGTGKHNNIVVTRKIMHLVESRKTLIVLSFKFIFSVYEKWVKFSTFVVILQISTFENYKKTKNLRSAMLD